MCYLLQVLKGILIGAGAILPGISSGVICMIFGIYEKLINSILNFFSDVKSNLKFLFPIGIGIFVGILIFGNFLKVLFMHYKVPASFCFAGFILGGIPSLLKKSEVGKINFSHILAFLLAFLLSVSIVYIEQSSNFSVYSNTPLVVAGFCMSCGVVIPGVSSTVILMLLGKYETYLSAVSSLNFSVLFPIGIGLCAGSLFFLLAIKYMLCHFKPITYFTIIGFILGSVFVLIPPIPNVTSFFTGVLAFTLGFFATIKLSVLH